MLRPDILKVVRAGLLVLAAAQSTCADENSVARLLRQLQSDDFVDRRAAREQLLAHGPSAVDALRASAEADDRALATDCVTLLARLAHDGDPEARRAAALALETLAEHAPARTAQLASSAVAPATAIADQSTRGGVPAKLQLQWQIGNRLGQPRLPAPNPQFRQVQMKWEQGRREIEVVEDARRLTISDTDGRQIRAVVTETDNGREVSREIQAQDLADLRAQAPDVAEAFQRYSAQLRIPTLHGRGR